MKIFVLLMACMGLVAEIPEEIDLSMYEVSIYSEHGEDGVLAKLFQVIPPVSRYCVELGASDGITASNTFLLRRQGWDCLLLDRMFNIPEYKLHQEFIRMENLNQLFDKYDVPYTFDLLSIDIGYNNFYVWQELDEKYQPKVVLIECNPTHLPSEDKVVKYRPFFCGDETDYYGASILALYRLGREKGYSLVYQESFGSRLFFVRDEAIAEHGLRFKNSNRVDLLYHFPKYLREPPRHDSKNRQYFSSIEILK